MADEPYRKAVKVGVQRGAGRPPGYRWNVNVLDQAFEEARSFLDDDQYEHLAAQVREPAREEDPTHSQTIDVQQIGRFHELRDKWGILGRINARIFFFLDHNARTLVVLGAINKKTDGAHPWAIDVAWNVACGSILKNRIPNRDSALLNRAAHSQRGGRTPC